MTRNLKSNINQRDGSYSKKDGGQRGPDGRMGYRDSLGQEDKGYEKGQQGAAFRVTEQKVLPGTMVKVVYLDDVSFHAEASPLSLEPDLFKDEAEYERVTNSVVARIRNGEIQPREPEQEED